MPAAIVPGLVSLTVVLTKCLPRGREAVYALDPPQPPNRPQSCRKGPRGLRLRSGLQHCCMTWDSPSLCTLRGHEEGPGSSQPAHLMLWWPRSFCLQPGPRTHSAWQSASCPPLGGCRLLSHGTQTRNSAGTQGFPCRPFLFPGLRPQEP